MAKLLFFVLSFSLLACSSEEEVLSKNDETQQNSNQNQSEMNYLKFSFGDASVPPKFHRSYDLHFENESVNITVDSYGDTLVDTSIVLGSDKVNEAFSLIEKHQIRKKNTGNKSRGCTGGTSFYITYETEEKEKFEANTYKCAGKFFGNLKGNIDELESDLTALIPNFSQFLD